MKGYDMTQASAAENVAAALSRSSARPSLACADQLSPGDGIVVVTPAGSLLDAEFRFLNESCGPASGMVEGARDRAVSRREECQGTHPFAEHGPLEAVILGHIATVVATSRVWVLLSYRMPQTPSTRRIAVWRRLKRLGVAQLGDGLVALPEDPRTQEQLEWVAADVEAADGTAFLWRAELVASGDEQRVADGLRRGLATSAREALFIMRNIQGWTSRGGVLSRTTRTRGRSVCVFAEQLGGTEVVNANVYPTSTGDLLKPCEMPAANV